MVFSSVTFLFVFLPIVLGIYFLLPHRVRNGFLLISSLFFYTWGEGRLVLIMLFSTAVDYVAARVIAGDMPDGNAPSPERTLRQRLALLASVIVNLSLLGVFKYFNFALDNAYTLLAHLGWTQWISTDVLTFVLPLGISFYTFQSMSYTIDVYRGHVPATRSFVDFACYVSMFPQLVAGPIVRYRDVSKHLVTRRTTLNDFAEGIRQFVIGLGKKMLIADTLQRPVNLIFALPHDEITFATAWIGAVFFCLQLFYDFAGYSDMAIGLGRMLGFRFPVNFRYPYIARTVAEFWQRWHITLSTWLRDYVYASLGGGRVGPWRSLFNLLFTFFLCGLWHGASWNFIIFGFNMGLLIALERATGLYRQAWYMKTPICHVYILALLAIHMVLFRAADLSTALAMWKAMIGLSGGGSTAYSASMILNGEILLAGAFALAGSVPLVPWLHDRLNGPQGTDAESPPRVGAEWIRQTGVTMAVVAVYIACAMKLAADTYQPFIYFRF